VTSRELTALGVDQVHDPVALRLIEALLAENRVLQEVVQQLRDEVARLKGEQGQPTIRPRVPQDHSSEAERPPDGPPTPRRPDRRVLVVPREEIVRLDRSSLPVGVEHAGYEDYVVQEVHCEVSVVRYRREAYRDPATGQRWVAPLPAGITDHYGPQVKALVLHLYYAGGMSEPKIVELLTSLGLRLSGGTLSAWLIDDVTAVHAEAAAVYAAGLASSPWQQIDDTLTRVNGEPHHCQVVCNPCYTSYHTTPAKDRLTIVDLLRPGQEGTYRCDDLALDWLAQVGVSAGVRARVAAHLPRDTILDHAQLRALLEARLPDLGPQTRSRIYDALAIAAYQQQTTLPVVQVLVCDEAGQFRDVTVGRALCWVHDARHYNKLVPRSWEYQVLLQTFLAAYWAFYAALLAYRGQPTPTEQARLREQFGSLFRTVTGYADLDARIASTLAHEADLLQVLDHPELPLHNNLSELGARRRVRKRDVSFGPRTHRGVIAWDSLQTLAATAQQHGVNFLHYLQDRLSGASQLPSLASRVTARAADLDLGRSWRPLSPSTS
jgi:Transposase IS66 family